MKDHHTRGPLRLSDVFKDSIISDVRGPGHKGFDHPAYGGFMVAESVHPENARRLVACWNACLGMDTEELEKRAAVILGQIAEKRANKKPKAAKSPAI